MTGKIKSFSSIDTSGFITTEDGENVYFHSSAVLAYDLPSLWVGQMVSFDLESGAWPRAANVSVMRQHHLASPPAKHPGSTQFRYLGFDQIESIRAYKFQRFSPGEETKTFIVTTDLGLFRKHRVGLQEGPGLCLQTLMAALAGTGTILPPPSPRALTDQDMVAHLASRPVPVKRPRPRVPPRPHSVFRTP